MYHCENSYSISIIIPTLNSERVLKQCLESIFRQDYPTHLVEIIITDGGSEDATSLIVDSFLKINRFPIRICKNGLKTGEAGKALGANMAGNEVLAFIDSDNILPHDQWLKQMVAPFINLDIIATEPLTYTYRKADGYIDRYCALTGMNDPTALFIGVYDRACMLTGKWTGLPVQATEHDDYFHVYLKKDPLPTIGANGFLIRRHVLAGLKIRNYLFDVDVLKLFLKNNTTAHVAKVKTGIVHLYCPNIRTYFRKQKRRILDYHRFSAKERLSGLTSVEKRGIILFSFSCLTVFPLIVQSLYGYIRNPDKCWFFHPIACLSTFLIYSYGTLKTVLGFDIELSRKRWSQ